MSAPSGNGGNGGGQASPNATVGSVHVRKPLGAIPPKAEPKLPKMKRPAPKAPAKRKR